MKQKNSYKYQCSVWTPERKQWLIENTKGLGRQEAYDKFKAAFPDVQTTINGITDMRSRLKCAAYTRAHPSTRLKPLYSEHTKKGYIFVKVAMPNVWWSKAKFVYVATHPEKAGEILETDSFYFLDGNNRNFDWQNIELVHRYEQTLFINCGGIVPGQPDISRIHLLQARLRLKQIDAAEKIGDVVIVNHFRVIKSERNAKAREYQKRKRDTDPEYNRRHREYAKNARKNWTPEKRQRVRDYQREWAKNKRLKEQGVLIATNEDM